MIRKERLLFTGALCLLISSGLFTIDDELYWYADAATVEEAQNESPFRDAGFRIAIVSGIFVAGIVIFELIRRRR